MPRAQCSHRRRGLLLSEAGVGQLLPTWEAVTKALNSCSLRHPRGTSVCSICWEVKSQASLCVQKPRGCPASFSRGLRWGPSSGAVHRDWALGFGGSLTGAIWLLVLMKIGSSQHPRLTPANPKAAICGTICVLCGQRYKFVSLSGVLSAFQKFTPTSNFEKLSPKLEPHFLKSDHGNDVSCASFPNNVFSALPCSSYKTTLLCCRLTSLLNHCTRLQAQTG